MLFFVLYIIDNQFSEFHFLMIYLTPGAAMHKVSNSTEGEEEGCVEENTIAKRRIHWGYTNA